MRSSYREEDVVWLLKDITGLVQPQPAEEREKLIQAGKHYCEMLPVEYEPSPDYMAVYEEALRTCAKGTAAAVGKLADRIMEKRGPGVVLVSLARAGTPIGILLKRYIRWKYHANVPHYSISIIRGKGIDKNAVRYLLDRYEAGRILFVDGWIGKGAIIGELEKETADFPGLSGELAVAADPANRTELCGTHADILIPSACLNCTVSGLVSRTFLRDDIIGPDDFHGALYYGELAGRDLSYQFIHEIEKEFQMESVMEDSKPSGSGMEETLRIAKRFEVPDVNLVKPGIGETTRVLLRRVPWRILISERHQDEPEMFHIRQLAKERGVPVILYPLEHYKSCGIIKKMADI